jgi:hypothetical protein
MHVDDFIRLGADKYVKKVDELVEAARRQTIANGKIKVSVPRLGWSCHAHSEELITAYKRTFCLALAADDWFEQRKPSWAPKSALSRAALGKLDCDDDIRFDFLSRYEFSLSGVGYNYLIHPPFHDHACGIMASAHAPDHLRTNSELIKEFCPRLLEGLDPALCWNTFEMISQRRQVLMRHRDHWRSRGMADEEDDMQEIERDIAELSQCYPSRFGVEAR